MFQPQIWRWNVNNNISFHYRLFPRKTNMAKFLKKSQELYFGAILGAFPQIWAKNEFSWKKTLPVFQYLNYLPLCQKSEKPNEPFLRKLLDGHTKNQFIALISLWDTANFRVQWLMLGDISGTRIFPNMTFVQAYKNYSNINFHYRPNW